MHHTTVLKFSRPKKKSENIVHPRRKCAHCGIIDGIYQEQGCLECVPVLSHMCMCVYTAAYFQREIKPMFIKPDFNTRMTYLMYLGPADSWIVRNTSKVSVVLRHCKSAIITCMITRSHYYWLLNEQGITVLTVLTVFADCQCEIAIHQNYTI